MKKSIKTFVLSIVLSLVGFTAFSQNGVRNSVERNTVVQYQTRGRLLTFISPQPRVKGSVYLYDTWKNRAVIEFNDGEKALARNINYNVDNNTFESLFGKDSIHQYNFETIKSITLNNKIYKQFNFKDDLKVFEVVFEDETVTILKRYNIHVYKASTNPMVNIDYDQYKVRDEYYLEEHGEIKRINLNKKQIIKLLVNQGLTEKEVKTYVKEKKLSFKNEFDVKMLLKKFLDS